MTVCCPGRTVAGLCAAVTVTAALAPGINSRQDAAIDARVGSRFPGSEVMRAAC
jgi:hypothetical protein